MPFATRTHHLMPEGAYQVLARANQLEAAGQEIIHLEIGQPDYPTFENVSQAGIDAIRTGKTRYTPPAGMPSLRAALAEDAGRRRGIEVQPDEVVVSPGGKPNLFFPTLALVEPGDEVIYPNPGFPTYEAMIKVAGGEPMAVPLLEENQFSFNLDVFDRLVNEKTRLIILNSPSNPTGGVIPPADLEHIASQAERYNCWVMSDELYTRIVYDGLEAPSIASFARHERAHHHRGRFFQNLLDDRLASGLRRHAQRTGRTCRFAADAFGRLDRALHPVRRAGSHYRIAGHGRGNGGRVSASPRCHCGRIERNSWLRLPETAGCVLCFPEHHRHRHGLDRTGESDPGKSGVALLPGNSFGEYGEGYLRLSYANSIENIRKGLERIKSIL